MVRTRTIIEVEYFSDVKRTITKTGSFVCLSEMDIKNLFIENGLVL